MREDDGNKRVKLNLADLVVESFDTLPTVTDPARGTVRAFQTEEQTCGIGTGCGTYCQTICVGGNTCATCDQSCAGSCQGTCQCEPTQTCGLTVGNTCEGGNTCGSCQFTCTPACQSAWTYASCGGSCEETDCPGQGNCTQVFPYCNEV